MDKSHKNPKRGKDNSKNDNGKKDLSTPKTRVKKPKEDEKRYGSDEYIGDGSAGIGGTSAI